MPSRDRAAYMRSYRAKNRSTPRPAVEPDLSRDEECWEEVARLKRLLAERAQPMLGGSFNSRPFTPVPKPGSRK